MDIFQNVAQLKRIPLLSGCTERELKLLAFTSESIKFSPDEYLFKSGDTSDAVYVILDGEVGMWREVNSENPLQIATAGKDVLFGEMAVFLNSTRIVSVKAIDKVETLKIPNERFIELITGNPKVALEVMRQLSMKIAENNALVAKLQAQS